MKKLFTSVCLSVCFLLAVTQVSKAADSNVYFVTSGQKFVLKPVVGGLVKFLWKIDNTVTKDILATDNAGALEHTFTGATNAIVEHKISLQVLSALDGCLSSLVEYTVVELPKLVVEVADPDKLDFCQGTLPDLKLTAKLNVLPSNLAAFNVSISPFQWTKDGETISANLTGNDKEILQVVAAGTYAVTAKYNLPTDGIFKPLATKLEQINTVSKVITTSVALPGLPVISLE